MLGLIAVLVEMLALVVSFASQDVTVETTLAYFCHQPERNALV